MLHQIVEFLPQIAINTISLFGYPGIFSLTLLESTLIPIPSEIVVPFSSFLASQGRFSIWAVILVSTFGSLTGSWIAYAIGFYLEKRVIRKLILKYGKFVFFSEEEYSNGLHLLRKHSLPIIFFARMTPGLKVIISLPCGSAKVPFFKFSILTFLGSLVYSSILSFFGYKLGKNWINLKPLFLKFDLVIAAITIIIVIWVIYKKLKK